MQPDLAPSPSGARSSGGARSTGSTSLSSLSARRGPSRSSGGARTGKLPLSPLRVLDGPLFGGLELGSLLSLTVAAAPSVLEWQRARFGRGFWREPRAANPSFWREPRAANPSFPRAQGIPAAVESLQRLLQRAQSRRLVLGARAPIVDERDADQASSTARRSRGGVSAKVPCMATAIDGPLYVPLAVPLLARLGGQHKRWQGNCFDTTDSTVNGRPCLLACGGLAAVCVDGTTGDLFRKPSVVAVDLRKEMVDYIVQRSETFIADALIESEANQAPENEMPDDPFEIVSIFMDDFSSTKRNIIGHVSGWLLSDSREDKIDDFAQEMEMTKFWPLDRREAIAEVLLKNVDIKTKFHCPEKYENEERLADHKEQCSFRPVTCPNDGCRAKVSVRCMDDHDAACPFKVLQCEQNCEKRLLRRDMDRHCVTVCSMRPMKCPFSCDSSFPERDLEKHCSEFLQAHLLKSP
nr:unnamed protein product [Digitaria exilis]